MLQEEDSREAGAAEAEAKHISDLLSSKLQGQDLAMDGCNGNVMRRSSTTLVVMIIPFGILLLLQSDVVARSGSLSV